MRPKTKTLRSPDQLSKLADDFLNALPVKDRKLTDQTIHAFALRAAEKGISYSRTALESLLRERIAGFDETQEQRLTNLVQPSYQPQGAIDQFLSTLENRPKSVLKMYTSLVDDVDLTMMEEMPLEELLVARNMIRDLAKKMGADEATVKKAIAERLRHFKPEPVSVPAQKDAVTLRKIRLAHGPLNNNLPTNDFIRSLTDEGRDMAEELLLMADISDAAAVMELETKSGKSGYAQLALFIVNRLNVSPQARNEMCESIKAIKIEKERRLPFVRPENPGQPTASPWVAPKPYEGAVKIKRDLPQILAEFKPIERKLLLAELNLSKSNFDGEKPIRFQLLPRCIQLMIESGLDPEKHTGQLQMLLEGKLPTGSGKVPFARHRKPGQKLTDSPWGLKISAEQIEEVSPLIDRMTSEARNLLAAVLMVEDPANSAMIEEALNECAPGSTEKEFNVMNRLVTDLAKKLKRPLENVRQALRLSLGGAKVLPAGQPGMTAGEARQAPTVLSSVKQKGILDRLRAKKK